MSNHYATPEEWQAEARRRFGDDAMNWEFVCPVCKHRQSTRDYKNAGAPQSAVAFSCVGRWANGTNDVGDTTEVGCDYAGGGLFKLNPVTVGESQVFAFADVERKSEGHEG